MDMRIELPGLNLDNPIMPASGTFGFGYEFADYYDLNTLGSIVLKATTLNPRYGNPLPRIAECQAGLLNAIGLQNPGIEQVLNVELAKLEQVYQKPVIANVAGFSVQEYLECAKQLETHPKVAALEINVSCPNVKCGGISFGTDPKMLYDLCCQLKAVTTKPLYIKLSPNVTDIVSLAKACEEAKVDGLVLINTLIGMQIDIKTRKPVLSNQTGGLSGPAIKPVAIRMIYQVASQVNLPIIGCGGVQTAHDVIEMMLAGASAVQVGSANLVNPYACDEIIQDLPKLMKELNIESLKTIIKGGHHE